MLGHGVRLAFGFLALAVADSAEAQGDLDQGKSAVQLFASACATCHKSPQSVSETKWFFGLESFLREHYTSSSESAAILAGRLPRMRRTRKAQPPSDPQKEVRLFGLLPQSDCSDYSVLRQAPSLHRP